MVRKIHHAKRDLNMKLKLTALHRDGIHITSDHRESRKPE